ncbi:MAG: hypothetical protein GQE15_18320 [Archangiaceae bacterium]|nr:hypothetical protein [Archangiaceae bacterium]
MGFTKSLDLCMVADDERALSEALRASHPTVAFVNDVVFPTPDPVLLDSIDQAKHFGQVLLWERTNFPTLPVMRRNDGRWEGPTVGPVIQYLKPVLKADRLQCGRIAASGGTYDEPLESANNAFIKDVWAAAKKLTTGVKCVDDKGRLINDKVPALRAGFHAAEWLRKKRGRFFTDYSWNLYLPLETAKRR